MKKEFRIKKNEDFTKVFNNGKSVANRQFVIYILKKEGQDHFRLGLSVSKRVGNAVTRNRIKRIIRELFHEFESNIVQNNDYVVIARKPTADMDFNEMKSSLLHVMKKARLVHKESKEKIVVPKKE